MTKIFWGSLRIVTTYVKVKVSGWYVFVKIYRGRFRLKFLRSYNICIFIYVRSVWRLIVSRLFNIFRDHSVILGACPRSENPKTEKNILCDNLSLSNNVGPARTDDGSLGEEEDASDDSVSSFGAINVF